jgi:cyclopropane fatty-acyl-phospholipid synthase-like methyltransferase
MENVNNSYFDGYYKEIWLSIIPAELTVRETEFMLQHFNLGKGSKVLDIMCGYGRHAIALAKKGVEVTAVDNLADYTDEVRDIVNKENIPVTIINEDVINFKTKEVFDLAICMGNSLNFFPAEDQIKLLSSVSSQIKKDGHLLIHTWSLAEIAIREFKEKSWSNINGLKYLSDAKYLFNPTRIETETTIISSEGITEIKKAIDYIFSVAEMEVILEKAGFAVKEIYSIPGRKKFTVGEPRAYIVGEKLSQTK